MTGSQLTWLVTVIVALIISSLFNLAAWWLRRRRYRRALLSWDEHVDQALTTSNQPTGKFTPDEWDEAVRRARSNVRHLRSRRDKIN